MQLRAQEESPPLELGVGDAAKVDAVEEEEEEEAGAVVIVLVVVALLSAVNGTDVLVDEMKVVVAVVVVNGRVRVMLVAMPK